MAITDKSEWILYDTDLITRLRYLPVVSGHLLLEMNTTGTGEVKIPLDSEAAGILTTGMFVQNKYRGSARGGFFIENIKKDEVNLGENGERFMSISGKGAPSILEHPIIWDGGTTESKREFSGMSKAAILIDLLEEAQARGGLSTLTWDFTDTEDSNAVAWDDIEEYQITTGDSILNVLQDLADVGSFDFDVEISGGNFVLSLYKNGIGANKANTVFFRAGTNCKEIATDVRGDDLINVYLVKYRDGFTVVKDDTSISANGRREKIINVEQAQSVDSAVTYAAAKLAETKDPKTSHTLNVYDGQKPFVFADYELGDTVTYDVKGVKVSHRVLRIQADYENDDFANVIVELNNVFNDGNLKRARELDWLMKQWNTARDANLLEVRNWVPLTLPTDVIDTIYDSFVFGDYIYFVGGLQKGVGGSSDTSYFKYYQMSTGQWGSLTGGSSLTTHPASVYVTPNGNIYVGNNGGITLQLYRWDGTSWFGFLPGEELIDGIWAMAHDPVTNSLYLGGQFARLDSVDDTTNVARLDLNTYLLYPMGAGLPEAIPPGSIPTVRALCWDSSTSRLYIAGDIPTYNNICYWDGSSYNAMGSGLDGRINALAIIDGNIVAGGEQTGYLSEFDEGAGTWSTVAGAPNDIVRDLQTYLSDLYVAGDFEGGVFRISGGYAYTLDGGTNADVNTIAMHEQTLIAAGEFSQAGDVTANKIAAYFVNFDDLVKQLSHSQSMYDLGAGIHEATAITTPLDADEFPLWKSSVQLLRKVTWANIKATLAGAFMDLTTNQTAAGIKRFSDSIRVGIDPPIAETDGGISQAQEGVSVGNFLWTWGTGFASFITGMFSRGTKASPTQALTGDIALKLRGRFHDGTNYGNTSAEIRHVADETHDATGHGTRIESYTTPIDSTTLTLAHTIGSDGLGRGSAMAFQRKLKESFSLADGASLVLAEYMEFGEYEIILNGDAEVVLL